MLRLLLFAALLSLAAPTLLSAAAADKPNFVVVVTDDQRYDAMSVVQAEQGEEARFPWFKTPNMDRLAASGTRFRNAFVVNSLCSPSRACFLTGRYNHSNGITDNKTPLPPDLVTYASLLRRNGYTTGYIGKWHMDGQKGKRPGFDWSASFVGQGRYRDCPVEINGESTPTEGWIDDVSTDYALDFLGEQSDDKPFCLVIGYKTPHGPRTPDAVPDRLKDRYTGEEIASAKNADARPPYLASGEDSLPARARQQRRRANSTNSVVYFQLLQGIDENLGRLLDTLDQHELSDNTIVIFTSDNGYFLGDHGIGDKRAAYDESLRIPFLMRVPGQQPSTTDAMTLNIDLAPTLLDYAGLSIPDLMQGRSLRPLFEGDTPDSWRTSFVYEYFEEPPYKVPTNYALRTTDAKLIVYPGHDNWTELFNLKSDPYEMTNLATDPQHQALRDRLHEQLRKDAQSLGLPIPLPATAQAAIVRDAK